jgi:hypothetical protein
MEMADKLWDLANIVTGFSVAQSLATTFMLAKDEMKLLHDETGYRLMCIGTGLFTLFYVVVIVLCGIAGAKPHDPDGRIWWFVTGGRGAAVIFFTLVLYGTIYGHRYARAQRDLSKPLLDKRRDLT